MFHLTLTMKIYSIAISHAFWRDCTKAKQVLSGMDVQGGVFSSDRYEDENLRVGAIVTLSLFFHLIIVIMIMGYGDGDRGVYLFRKPNFQLSHFLA